MKLLWVLVLLGRSRVQVLPRYITFQYKLFKTYIQTIKLWGAGQFSLTPSFYFFVSLPELFLFSAARMSDLRALWVEEGAGS